MKTLKMGTLKQRHAATGSLIDIIDQIGEGLHADRAKPTKKTVETAIRRIVYLRHFVYADYKRLSQRLGVKP